jgi:hypothetical protein
MVTFPTGATGSLDAPSDLLVAPSLPPIHPCSRARQARRPAGAPRPDDGRGPPLSASPHPPSSPDDALRRALIVLALMIALGALVALALSSAWPPTTLAATTGAG